MKQLRVITWPLRLGLVAAVAGIALVSVSGWRATHFDAIPRVSAPPTETTACSSDRIGRLSCPSGSRGRGDPFHPERRRPQIRYELPVIRSRELPQASAPPRNRLS